MKPSLSFDVSDAVDMHVHCGPEGIPRLFDAIQMARHVKETGLTSVVMKSHFMDTSSWAQMAHRETGVRLCGSITLNHYVGGINPMAVRSALGPGDAQGGFLKTVWLPTVHANAHLCMHCAAGDTHDIPAEWGGGVLSAVARPITGLDRISVLADSVQPALREVLDLVAEHDLVLGTGHVGAAEVHHVLDLAKRAGAKKVVVTHANYSLPGIGIPEMIELAGRGAYIELAYVVVDLGLGTAKDVAEAMRQVGADHIVLSTDVGQVDRAPPGKALQHFGELLLREGVSLEDIETSMKRVPRMLIGAEYGPAYVVDWSR